MFRVVAKTPHGTFRRETDHHYNFVVIYPSIVSGPGAVWYAFGWAVSQDDADSMVRRCNVQRGPAHIFPVTEVRKLSRRKSNWWGLR